MAQEFNDLSTNKEALCSIVREMGLVDASTPIEVTQLTGGVSSGILKLTAGTSVFCVKQALPKLKVEKDWHVPTNRVFAEIGWLQTVADIAPRAVPKILGVNRKDSCFAMEFLPPEQFPNWKTKLLEGEVDVAFASKVGETLALIHAGTANNKRLEQEFANDANFHAIRLEAYLEETARVHPDLSDLLLALVKRTQQKKIALMQGDISPKNILCGPDGPVFIDAECACYGDPAFDLAFCTNHLLLKALYNPAQMDAYLASFDALCAAYLANISWESAEEFEKRAATLLPGLTLARADGKSPVEYLNDAQRDVVRRAAIPALKAELSSLADVKTIWEKELRS